jgi:hypothetical protein
MNSKAREALKDAKRTLCRWQADLPVSGQVEVEDTLLKIKSALAEPLRNCDVGSLDEQITRFNAFCDSYMCRSLTNGCPLVDSRNCRLAWAQMPYKKEGER